jgi:hypothetical protein
MILSTEEQIKNMKWKDNVQFKCDGCGELYEKTKRTLSYNKKKRSSSSNTDNQEKGKIFKSFHTYNKTFCNDKCKISYNRSFTVKEYSCKVCNKLFTGYVKKTPKFCGHSCAATHSNSHKTKGCRRSKLEMYLENTLIGLYPDIKFKFNCKKEINSELDIYIPELKLAFELNGIFHYEPIYGTDTLSKIQNNDNRKFQACLENNIELCIIDTSKQSYFKESTSKIYLDIIKQIIDNKIIHLSKK